MQNISGAASPNSRSQAGFDGSVVQPPLRTALPHCFHSFGETFLFPRRSSCRHEILTSPPPQLPRGDLVPHTRGRCSFMTRTRSSAKGIGIPPSCTQVPYCLSGLSSELCVTLGTNGTGRQETAAFFLNCGDEPPPSPSFGDPVQPSGHPCHQAPSNFNGAGFRKEGPKVPRARRPLLRASVSASCTPVALPPSPPRRQHAVHMTHFGPSCDPPSL